MSGGERMLVTGIFFAVIVARQMNGLITSES